MDYPVKYAHSGMRGAPVISGQPGSLLHALDTFLRTGFGAITAQTVNVDSGIATATISAGQGFEPHCVIQVDGATPDALNGLARVLPTVTPTQLQWATNAPDGPATGTITLRVAPVGSWERVWHDPATFKAVYRSTDVQGTRMFYRIDDSDPLYTRVRGYESMQDIDTGSGPFPLPSQASDSGFRKSRNNNTAPVRWKLLADSRFVYIVLAPFTSTNASSIGENPRGFGDLVGISGADNWLATVSCMGAFQAIYHDEKGTYINSNIANGLAGIYVARAVSGDGASVLCRAMAYSGSSSNSGADNVFGSLAESVNGALLVSGVFVAESGKNTPRANVPGLFSVPMSGVLGTINPGDDVYAQGDLHGRRLVALSLHGGSGLSSGVYLADTIGPWR